MYVGIDRDNLRFLSKHTVYSIVSNVSWIEAPPRITLVVTQLGHPSFLRDFTDFELQLLYKNTTGIEPRGYYRDAMRAVLLELAERLPMTDADEREARIQAQCLPPDDDRTYKYVKGALHPAVIPSLMPALSADRNENEEVIAAAVRLGPADSQKDPLTNTAARTRSRPSAAPRGQKNTPRVPGVPRPGSVSEKIWVVADRMWEAAGKPTEKASVLALRKQMMDVLEKDYSIKRTSSSNELGNWSKARIK